MTKRKFVLKDDDIYEGDNGRTCCGKHHGYTARVSGRDLDGTKMRRVTIEEMREENAKHDEDWIACEECGLTPDGRTIKLAWK